MEEVNSEVTGDAGGEVERLQEELCKAKERLQSWKEKAQIGVNELRKRILELTLERDELREACAVLKQQQQHDVSDDFSSTSVSISTISGSFLRDMTQWTNSTLVIFLSVLLNKSEVALDVASSFSQSLEKHKQRTVQTLKLQTKNVETLQLEVSSLREQLNNALVEIKERNYAIENRDSALTVLQNRLEDLEAANARLEAVQSNVNNALNADQINAFEERLEEKIEKLRREFTAREDVISDQHRDEIERLVARYEEEIAGLRVELEERALAASAEAAAAAAAMKVETLPEGGVTETAYMELVEEWETTREELKVVREEKDKLILELQDIRRKTAQRGHNHHHSEVSDSGSVGLQCQPRTLSEALARIAELEGNTMRLSEELCEAKRRLIASKHQANAKETSRSQVLEGQQLSYLKFVVVKLLCANGDTNVAMNLFPVLSTLLHFNSNDLQEIYDVNPSWVKRKF